VAKPTTTVAYAASTALIVADGRTLRYPGAKQVD
jgi:hypothetical protein